MKRCFFYGTLKRGHYNHARFSGLHYKNRLELHGYSLVQPSGLPFPYIIPDEEGKVVGEVFYVEDDTYDTIKRMELGAGYEEVVKAGLHFFVGTEDYLFNLPRHHKFPIEVQHADSTY